MKCPNCRGNTDIIYINKNMPYGIKFKDIKHDVILNKREDCDFIFQSSLFNNEHYKNIFKRYESYTITDMYNLPKIESFQENHLVILCSSNKLIQEKMASTLPKNIAILFPWEKIENV